MMNAQERIEQEIVDLCTNRVVRIESFTNDLPQTEIAAAIVKILTELVEIDKAKVKADFWGEDLSDYANLDVLAEFLRMSNPIKVKEESND